MKSALPEPFVTEMLATFGETALKRTAEDLMTYGQDWTRAVPPNPSAVFFPTSTSDVSRFLACCQKHQVAVVPSGGRTGLAGGAVAAQGEVVLSLAKMNRIGEVNLISQTVRVQAGAVTQAVHEACAPHGVTWPVDLASKGSCHVGGNIATNAGGIRVIRYGHTRQWVQSLQVVLMSGEVLELNGELEKNNTGYDFRHLIIGSEGTLAVVTEATLKLARLPQHREVLFLSVPSMTKVLHLMRAARTEGWVLQAFECLTQHCAEAVKQMMNISVPVGTPQPFYVLMEIETDGREETVGRLAAWVDELLRSGIIADGVLATSSEAARKFWSVRENITESLARKGVVYKNDLSLPLVELDAFVVDLYKNCERWYDGCEIFVFGHIGDGNLHINVLKSASMDTAAFLKMCEGRNEELFALVQQHRGSIAAEHGIGLLKKRFLGYTRAPTEIQLMRSLKRVFDPENLLNPGKIFD